MDKLNNITLNQSFYEHKYIKNLFEPELSREKTCNLLYIDQEVTKLLSNNHLTARILKKLNIDLNLFYQKYNKIQTTVNKKGEKFTYFTFEDVVNESGKSAFMLAYKHEYDLFKNEMQNFDIKLSNTQLQYIENADKYHYNRKEIEDDDPLLRIIFKYKPIKYILSLSDDKIDVRTSDSQFMNSVKNNMIECLNDILHTIFKEEAKSEDDDIVIVTQDKLIDAFGVDILDHIQSDQDNFRQQLDKYRNKAGRIEVLQHIYDHVEKYKKLPENSQIATYLKNKYNDRLPMILQNPNKK